MSDRPTGPAAASLTPLSDLPLSRLELWAWCLYDFANSSFTTLIVTVAYSIYFVQVVAQGLPEGQAERLWFWGYGISMLVAAVLAPLLGTIADARANKRSFLVGSTVICIVSTALLAFVEAGDVMLGLVLFGIANVAFDLGFMFCSAFLVEIAAVENMGRISGYGWGLGYLGGLLSLALAYPFIKGGFTETNLPLYRASFAMTAAFFLIASLPTLLLLRERAVAQVATAHTAWREAFSQLAAIGKQFRRFRDLSAYLIAYLIYTDAINTVIVASAIFANKVLDFSPADLIIYFLVTQTTAAVGAVTFGILADRIGAKRTITLTLMIWTILAVSASLVQTHGQFYIIGLLAGAVLGANQTTSRTLLARFTPIGRQAQFFGFFSITGKFAAIIGPVVYGEVTAWTGSQRWAIVSMAVFFLIGLMLIQFVDERRGIAVAATGDTPWH